MNEPRIPFPLPPFDVVLPRDHGMADWYVERIEQQIAEFRANLQPGDQMAVVVVLNDGQRILPTWFGYHNPNMLVIDGEDQKGRDVRLLVAHTNVQIVLTRIEEGDELTSPMIGFQPRTAPTEA